MNKAEYREYLKSDHWKGLKARKYAKRKMRCGICGSTNSPHLHHLQYKNIYDVETSDLRCLCGICHKTFHDLQSAGFRITSKNHHGIFNQTKSAVKKARGLVGNQFYPSPPADTGSRVPTGINDLPLAKVMRCEASNSAA